MNYLIDEEIFSKDKIYLLRDPVINIEKLKYLQKESIDENELSENFLSALEDSLNKKIFL